MCGRGVFIRRPGQLVQAAKSTGSGRPRVVRQASAYFRNPNFGPGNFGPIIYQANKADAGLFVEDVTCDQEHNFAQSGSGLGKAQGDAELARELENLIFDSPSENSENVKGASVLHFAKWGLVPSFGASTESPQQGIAQHLMINARCESLTQRAAFKGLVQRRRAVAVLDGFYEWREEKGKKQGYLVQPKEDGKALLCAALYDICMRPGEPQPIVSYTIITTNVNQHLGWLHDRMPVILSEQDAACWLDCDNVPYAEAAELLRPCGDILKWHAVPPLVNNIRNKSMDCMLPKKEWESREKEKGMQALFGTNSSAIKTCTSVTKDSNALGDDSLGFDFGVKLKGSSNARQIVTSDAPSETASLVKTSTTYKSIGNRTANNPNPSKGKVTKGRSSKMSSTTLTLESFFS